MGGEGAIGVARLLKSIGGAPHPTMTTAKTTNQATVLMDPPFTNCEL
jgi:hypothetical protein